MMNPSQIYNSYLEEKGIIDPLLLRKIRSNLNRLLYEKISELKEPILLNEPLLVRKREARYEFRPRTR